MNECQALCVQCMKLWANEVAFQPVLRIICMHSHWFLSSSLLFFASSHVCCCPHRQFLVCSSCLKSDFRNWAEVAAAVFLCIHCRVINTRTTHPIPVMFRSYHVPCYSVLFISFYLKCMNLPTHSFGRHHFHPSAQPIRRQRRHFGPLGGEIGADGCGTRGRSDHWRVLQGWAYVFEEFLPFFLTFMFTLSSFLRVNEFPYKYCFCVLLLFLLSLIPA